MIRRFRPYLVALALVSCADSQDDEQLSEVELAVTSNVTVNRVDTGTYTLGGSHDAASKAYRTGNFGGELRSYYVFDVPSSAAFLTNAQLVATNGGCGQVGGSGFDVLRLYDVTTPAATVMAAQTNRGDIFSDLGAGTELANLSLSGTAITAPTVTVTFNANGLNALKKAAGTRLVIGAKFFDTSVGKVFDHTECDPSPGAVTLQLVVPNQAPIARCKDVTTCATAGKCDAPASIDDGSSDPDGDTLTYKQTPVMPFGLGTTAVQLTVTDTKGVSASCTANVTVRDCEAPTVTCPAPIDAECTGAKSAVLTAPGASATDTCSSTSTTQQNAQAYPLGTSSVPYTATDGAGNTANCSTTVTVHDTTAPVIQCPAPKTAECTGNNSATTDAGTAQAADVCTDVTITSNAPASFPLGTTAVGFQATDEVGNHSQCTTSVTVVDTQAPSITCPAAQTAECTGNHSATIDLGQASASDVCTTATASHVAPASYPIGSTSVTYTATDGNGLSSTCTTTATVIDTTPPTIACPAPVTAECTGNASATVNPGHASASDVCGDVAIHDAPAGSYGLGTTATVFSATDDAGHTVSCASSVTVVDTTPPAIQCPAPTVVECQANGTATVDLPPAIASDSCGGAAATDPAAAAYGLGTTPVLYAANDANGNAASCVATVTVVDTQGAQFANVPAPVQTEATGATTPVALALPTATDGCEGALTVTSDAPAAFPVGTTTVTFTATDSSGNVAHATTTVTIVDTEAPVISNVPAPVTIKKNTQNGAIVSLALPTATDTHDGNVPVTSDAPAVFPLGTTTVTFTATDSSGNTATATTTVTVYKGKSPPTITALYASPSTIKDKDNKWQDVSITATATDDDDPHPTCSIVEVSSNQPQNSCGHNHSDKDWKITGALTLKVRAERKHNQDRVYSVKVRCKDTDNDSADGTTTVTIIKH